MRINKNNHTVFIFPTGLIINKCTVGIIRIKLKKEGINIPKKQILAIAKETKRYKKRNPDWNFIEINEKSGMSISFRI